MRNNTGQVTLFLILGLVIVIGLGFAYSMGNSASSEKIKAEAEKSAGIPFSFDYYKNFLNSCLENIAKGGIDFIGQRDGYFNLASNYFNDPFIKTAYYFYEDFSLFPKIEVLQDSISEYMKSYASFCFEELKNLTEFAKIDYEIGNVNAIIAKNSVIVDAQIPTKIKLGDITSEINNFRISLDGNRLLKD